MTSLREVTIILNTSRSRFNNWLQFRPLSEYPETYPNNKPLVTVDLPKLTHYNGLTSIRFGGTIHRRLNDERVQSIPLRMLLKLDVIELDDERIQIIATPFVPHVDGYLRKRLCRRIRSTWHDAVFEFDAPDDEPDDVEPEESNLCENQSIIELETVLENLDFPEHHKEVVRRWYAGETAEEIHRATGKLAPSTIHRRTSEWRNKYPELAPFLPLRISRKSEASVKSQ